jgi:predicted ribosomally synthesized peptide with SipW-like signal peptide
MKKKIVLLCTAAAMVAVLAVGGTLAYLQDQTATATNTFTIGEVSGALLENGSTNNEEPITGSTQNDNIYYDWDGVDSDREAENIVPGQRVQKAPRVENDGLNDVYVRLTVTGVDFSGIDDIDWTAAAGEDFVPSGLNLGTDDNEWTYSDGKFYYNSAVLAAGEDEDNNVTEPLFTAVKLKGSVVSGSLGDVAIYAELIQANFLEDGEGEKVTGAIDAFKLYTATATADPTGE